MLSRIVAILAIASLVCGCGGAVPPVPSPSAPATTAATSSVSPSSSGPPPSAAAGIHYVAFGDSIPFGGADCGCRGFPLLFGDWVEQATGEAVDTKNFAQHDNNTAAREAVELSTHPDLVAALRAADIITVTLGHNDTPWNAIDDACDADHGPLDPDPTGTWKQETGPCLQKEVDRYRANLAAVLDQVIALRGGRPVVLRLTEQYNDIPGDPCCGADAVKASATIKDAFNAAACEVVAAHGGLCIDVYHAFNGPDGRGDAGALLAGDHTHPSAAGHEKIAKLLEEAGLAPVR